MNTGQVFYFILKFTVSLAVVLAAIILILRYGLPRLLKITPRKGGHIRILETAILDRTHRLCLVHVRDRILLLGYGGGAVRTLYRWRDPNRDNRSLTQTEPGDSP